VSNVSVLVAIGVNDSGYRKILGIAEGAKEDKAGWSSFLRHLKERGLSGVRLFTSDACLGLVESLGDFYPEAKWQRCTVHFYRNIFSHVPRSRMAVVADMLKAIHAAEDLKATQRKAQEVIEKLEAMRLANAARILREAVDQSLAYYHFPREHRRRIRTNNALERIIREIRRRTRVVGAFPDGQSALMLCAARLRHIAGSKWGQKRYLNIDLLKDQELEEQIEAASA
jgi:transposase-like protein